MRKNCLVIAIALLFNVVYAPIPGFYTLIQTDVVLLKCYTHWCGFCKLLAPEWEKLGGLLEGKVKVLEADCMVDGDFCNKQGVRGYPSIYVYKNGQKFTYSGPRTAAAISEFALSFYEPPPPPSPLSPVVSNSTETTIATIAEVEEQDSGNVLASETIKDLAKNSADALTIENPPPSPATNNSEVGAESSDVHVAGVTVVLENYSNAFEPEVLNQGPSPNTPNPGTSMDDFEDTIESAQFPVPELGSKSPDLVAEEPLPQTQPDVEDQQAKASTAELNSIDNESVDEHVSDRCMM